MKKTLLGLLLCFSCTPGPEVKHDEDYVLIEFAAKLEEDYHRIQNIPYEPEFIYESSSASESDDDHLPGHHHP